MPQQQLYPQLAPILSAGSSNRFQTNSHEVLPPRPLQSAPHSHHIPSMGLGGALIAQNRSRHQQQQHLRSLTGDNSLSSSVRRISGSMPDGGPRNGINFFAIGNNFGFFDDHLDADSDADHMLALQLLAGNTDEGLRDWEPAFDPARAYIRAEVLRRRNNAREASPYRKDYSHPHPPEPGFTHDFALKSPMEIIDVTSPTIPSKSVLSLDPIIVDDENPIAGFSSEFKSQTQPHKSTNRPSLVCARCLEPFVLGNNLTSEEQRNRRIWGLRCGHLIDGKCLNDIGQPKYMDQQPIASTVAARVVDKKGKGKAKAMDEDENNGLYHSIQSPAHISEPEANSIRSRLRPRYAGTSSTNSPSSSSSAQLPVKRSAKSKSSTAQQPLSLPQFTWKCPVIGCGCVHASIKVDGEWIPERDDSSYSDSTVLRNGSGRNGGRGRGRVANWRISGSARTGAEKSGARGAIPLFL